MYSSYHRSISSFTSISTSIELFEHRSSSRKSIEKMLPIVFKDGDNTEIVPLSLLHTRKVSQKSLYTNFINVKLRKADKHGPRIIELYGDISKGEILLKFVELATKRSLNRVLPKSGSISSNMRFVETALDTLIEAKVIQQNDFSASKIVDHNESEILTLLWQIINKCYFPRSHDTRLRYHHISQNEFQEIYGELCKWINDIIQHSPYNMRPVVDFDYSFHDGFVLAAIVDRQRPELGLWNWTRGRSNVLAHVLEIIEEYYGVAPLFHVEQLVRGTADQRLVAVFVEMIREEVVQQQKPKRKDSMDGNVREKANYEKTIKPVAVTSEETKPKDIDDGFKVETDKQETENKNIEKNENDKIVPETAPVKQDVKKIKDSEIEAIEVFSKIYDQLSQFLEEKIADKTFDRRIILDWLRKLREKVEELEKLLLISDKESPEPQQVRDPSKVLETLKKLEKMVTDLAKNTEPKLDICLIDKLRVEMKTLENETEAFIGQCLGPKPIPAPRSKAPKSESQVVEINPVSTVQKYKTTFWISGGILVLLVAIILGVMKFYNKI